VAAQVVPGLCRLALEAACMEVVRRRRLGRGEPHGEVEAALRDAGRLRRLLALALFDDAGRDAEVPPRLEKGGGAPFAATLRQCDEGTVKDGAAAVELVRQSGKLAAWLRGLP
jgi:hypothetical protein